jgi:hypothetical protein
MALHLLNAHESELSVALALTRERGRGIPIVGDGIVWLGEESLALLIVHRPQMSAVLGQHGLNAVNVQREDGIELLLDICSRLMNALVCCACGVALHLALAIKKR